MGRPRSETRCLIAVATRQVEKYLSYLEQNMPLLFKLNPKFSS